jgi:predicted ATP-grasp superfamily ATP-dependent carboligase
MKPKLLVGISVRAAAQSAVRSGYPILALDSFGDTDLSATCENLSLMDDFPENVEPVPATERLYSFSRELDFDEVIYLSGFENHPECVEGWEREGKRILGNTSEVLRSVRNWEDLFAFLDTRNLPHPETITVGDISEFDPDAVDPREYLVKPVRSGGGHSIRTLDEVLHTPHDGENEPHPVVIQRLLRGTLASASFVSSEDDFRLLSTTLQLAGNQISPYKYCGNIAPLDAPPRIEREMEETARAVAGEYGLVGSNGVDFMISGGRANLLEVNPRPQGSLEVVELTSGVPVMDAHIRACRNDEIPNPSRRDNLYHGRKIVFSPIEATIGSLAGMDFVRDIPKPGTGVSPGEPICTVVGNSGSILSCEETLEGLEKKVISLTTEAGECLHSR